MNVPETVAQTYRNLHELNFRTLIDYDLRDPQNYSFAAYAANGYKHPDAKGFCTSCEENCPPVSDRDGFRLFNLSHGSHALDFLQSFSDAPPADLANWNHGGVLFVMESPSKKYGIYKRAEKQEGDKTYSKAPAEQWYWIHEKKQISGYPEYFRGSEYGNLVASAIATFRLSNAYLTNLVKCGLNNPPADGFLGLGSFNETCIEQCMKTYLKEEIEILKPKVIFAFGSKVFDRVSGFVSGACKAVGLPHPARRQGGFKDEYFNVLYFCMMAKWLYRTAVIPEAQYVELMQRFAQTE